MIRGDEMKKVRIKSAIPLYGVAALWLVLGFATPIYKLWMILVAACASLAAYFALSKAFPGRVAEVRERANSGDEEVNRDIEEGRAILNRIRESDRLIAEPEISSRVSRMLDAGEKILSTLEQDVRKAPQVRRFLNYYLPTTDKLLKRYRELASGGGSGENVRASRKTIADSMDMIAVAFEKQLDALYKDTALDIEADIEVLETIVKSEGHTEGTPLGGVK